MTTIQELMALAKTHGGKRRNATKPLTFGRGDPMEYFPVAAFAFREEFDQKAFIAALPVGALAASGPCDEYEWYWVYTWI